MPTEVEDKAAADKAAADKTVADKAAADKVTADKATADKAAADKVAADKSAADKIAADKAAADEASKAAKGGKADDDKGAEGAPEKYALTLPEGGAVDATDVAAIEKMAREHKLPNDAAQALLEQQNTYLIEQSEALAAQLTADQDYGGAKLADTQRLAKTVIDAVRPEGHPRRAAFQRILDKSGYGNHIEIASFLADLGKKMAEDVPVSGAGGGGGGGGRDADLAKRLYPNMK
jgi:hypothetical protein